MTLATPRFGREAVSRSAAEARRESGSGHAAEAVAPYGS
jgi:hypothetical protein